MLSRCFLDFSVGVRASVIGLSQISSFSLHICQTVKCSKDQQRRNSVQSDSINITSCLLHLEFKRIDIMKMLHKVRIIDRQ